MEYFDYFAKIFSSIGGLGFLLGLILLWKTGLLEFLLSLKKNGNGNGKTEKRIVDLESHATVANSEMKEVREELGQIRMIVYEIKGKIDVLISQKL